MLSSVVFWLRVAWFFATSFVADNVSKLALMFQPGVEKMRYVSVLRNGQDWMYLPRNLPPHAFESVSLVLDSGNEIDVTQPAHMPYPFSPSQLGGRCYRVVGLDGEAEDYESALV
jgi:hypothetical protein